MSEQESAGKSRDVDETTTLTEYVQNVMADDGLTDIIDEPDIGEE